jgi:hypothetical protein
MPDHTQFLFADGLIEANRALIALGTPNDVIPHRMTTRGNHMAGLIDTRDEDDDDGTAALYKDSGTEDVNEELGDDEDEEPIVAGDEDEDGDEGEEIDKGSE